MAYSDELAQRIRDEIGDHPALEEKQMFGGIAFMVHGNMSVGVSGEDLMVRVGKENHDEAIDQPHARIFDMGARPMKGWVLVDPAGTTDDDDLARWIDVGVTHAESLPAK